jgi:hypothetical protein
MSQAREIPLRILEGDLLGRAVAHEGELLVAVVPKAFPPGKPLELTLQLDAVALPLVCRVIGSKLREDGAFDLRMRLTNLRRGAREQLRAAFEREVR